MSNIPLWAREMTDLFAIRAIANLRMPSSIGTKANSLALEIVLLKDSVELFSTSSQ